MTRKSDRASGRPGAAESNVLSLQTGEMSRGTGDCARTWPLWVALASGCCATQPGGGDPVVVDGGPRPEQPRPSLPGDGPTPTAEYEVIDADEARKRLWPEPGPTAYVAPDERQSAALTTLVRGMLSEPRPARAELASAATAAGFTLEGWSIAGREYLAAVEQPARRGGGGAYVVRAEPAGASAPTILQAPHAFYDLGTERIALDMLLAEQGWPRALFVNTVHRYLGADGVRRKQPDSPADPCHSGAHLFAVATAAALEVLPGAEVVQLHGFGDDGDASTGPQPAAIVSGGLPDAPTPRSRVVAARLREALAVEVALFPVDTDRLGATTNVQGRVVRARGADFIHIEMSATLRRALRNDAAARARLATALRRDLPGTP